MLASFLKSLITGKPADLPAPPVEKDVHHLLPALRDKSRAMVVNSANILNEEIGKLLEDNVNYREREAHAVAERGRDDAEQHKQ